MRQLHTLAFGVFVICFAVSLLMALLSIIQNWPAKESVWF